MHATDECLALGGILAPIVPADKDMLTVEMEMWHNGGANGDCGRDWCVRVETYKQWERREFGGGSRRPIIRYRERTECSGRVSIEWGGSVSVGDLCRETGKTKEEIVAAIKAAEASERGVPTMVPVIRTGITAV